MEGAFQGDRKLNPVRVVARRTGLSASVLRAWERRYDAVRPGRSEGGHRLYSEEDVHRLVLLGRLVENGQSISRVASLGTPDLEHMVRQERVRASTVPPLSGVGVGSAYGGPKPFLEAATTAVRTMSTTGLEVTLTRSVISLSAVVVIDELLVPLLRRIGEDWASGEIGPAHEHVPTPVIRRFIEWLIVQIGIGSMASKMLVGTPTGQTHELGALLAAATAATAGWGSVLLGPDLPAREIAHAAALSEAEAVALSAIYPSDADTLTLEVGLIRKLLPRRIPLLLGGGAADACRDRLMELGVEVIGDLGALRTRLASASAVAPRSLPSSSS